MAGSKPRATIADLQVLADQDHRVELIDGEIVYKVSRALHGVVQGNLREVLGPFSRKPGGPKGPGGWWIMTEVHVLFPKTEEVYCQDVTGFRRERLPEIPKDWPVRLTPDWAAEVLSPSTARYDLVKKQRTLHLHGVPHYWIVDPEHETLTVLRHAAEGYLVALTAGLGDVVRAEPFEAVEISIAALFGKE